MRRCTTPTITATIDADLTGLDIRMAFRQSSYAPIVKTDDDLDVTIEGGTTTVAVALTQADTQSLRDGVPVDVQVRAIGDGGAVALATTIASIDVERILEDGVIDG